VVSAPARRFVGYRVKVKLADGCRGGYLSRGAEENELFALRSDAQVATQWEPTEPGRLAAMETLVRETRRRQAGVTMRLVRVVRVSAVAKERARCAALVLSLLERFGSTKYVHTTELDTLLVAIETGTP
jgi:hypothetical protein